MAVEVENEIWANFYKIVEHCWSNFKIEHINANGISGFKFYEIKNWLLSGRFYVFVISETKIDARFPTSCVCWRDQNAYGGGSIVLK